MTNAEARFNNSLRPWKPEGSLGRTAQDVHLDSHTAPELCTECKRTAVFIAQLKHQRTLQDQLTTAAGTATKEGVWFAGPADHSCRNSHKGRGVVRGTS